MTTYTHNEALTLIAEHINDLDYQQVKRVLGALYPEDNISLRITKNDAKYTIANVPVFVEKST